MAEVLRRVSYAVAVLLVLAVIIALLSKVDDEAESAFVTVGTGSVNGLYYPTGGAIAKLVNRKRDEYGFRLVVESTDGSRHNLNAVLGGEIEFGIIQGDLEYQAVHGEGDWYVKGPARSLRAITSLHEEAVTLLATDRSGIATLADLEGKRVNIGTTGSGQRTNAIQVLASVGIDWESGIEADESKPEDAAELLRQGEIDAFFFTAGHPNEVVEDATEGPESVRFVPIAADHIRETNPYYLPAVVPVHLYPNVSNREDVHSIGLSAILVTSETVDERIAYAVTANLFENLEEFRTLHPAFSAVSEARMMKGFTAPLHRGALRYFRQSGRLEKIRDGERDQG